MNRITQHRTRSCVLVKHLNESDEGFLEKVLELWSLGNKIYSEAWNTEFHVFGVVTSDTDHLPVGSVRSLCSKKFLETSDIELKEIIEFYGTELEEAYRDILLKHGDAQ